MNTVNDVIDWFLFGGALTALLVFWQKDLKPFLQTKINTNKNLSAQAKEQVLLDLANAAVIAIEHDVTATGSDKKQYAARKVSEELASLGLHVDQQHILDVIQYAFNQLIGGGNNEEK